MATYENKSIDTIKQDIRTEFKRIEKSKRWWYRDDQEIYEAWENIIDRYISELSRANWMWVSNGKWWIRNNKAEWIKSENLYKWEALKYFKEAKNRFKKRRHEVLEEHDWWWGCYITSSKENDDQIEKVAKSINTAEEEALKKIQEVCNPTQKAKNASQYDAVEMDKYWKPKTRKNNEWKLELVKQKPLFTVSRDWTSTFTDRVNPMKIDKALGQLFKDKDNIYRIDYSKCTNTWIKTKIKKLIWGLTCWIAYDTNSKTYVLTDRAWRILTNRALVWEWVTLKQDTIIKGQSKKDKIEWPEGESLERLRSTSRPFDFNANNYSYYTQFSKKYDTHICSSYAYWLVSDIIAKKWYCFTAPEQSAWKIANSGDIKQHFSINQIDSKNPRQQIVNAPAGTFLTMRFDNTKATASWVSHVMVSLWNGVYSDLFGPKIRKIDFKSETKFTWKKFVYWWASYTLTDDSRLMSPILWSFPKWSKQHIYKENITPEEFAKQICKSTWANEMYIKSLISKQNNIPLNKFWTTVKSISVDMVTREITNLELQNKEWSNDVANNFLDSIKSYKTDIMRHYPKLTNHEYDEIAKRAIWILYQESDGGDSMKYKWKEIAHDIGVTNLSSRDWSRWYTQLKFNQNFSNSDKNFLKTFGINGENDLTNARNCWIATMVWLIKKYYDYVVPMKSDPFWRNDAEIIELKFKDKKKESIARGKPLKQLGGRPRTENEIQAKISEWANKHGWIAEQNVVIRSWIIRDDDFFDFIYYARNEPSEIDFGTATPELKWTYAYKANNHIGDHLA